MRTKLIHEVFVFFGECLTDSMKNPLRQNGCRCHVEGEHARLYTYSFPCNRISDVIVGVLASSVIDRGFELRSSQTKKLYNWYLLLELCKHAISRSIILDTHVTVSKMTTVDGEDFFLKEEYVEISLPKHVFRVLYNIRGLMIYRYRTAVTSNSHLSFDPVLD